MTDLTTKIGAFDAETRSVFVTFTSGDIKHERRVNAMLKANGDYDKAGTKARVEEVARGVAHKIGLGVITVPQPDDAPLDDAEAIAE